MVSYLPIKQHNRLFNLKIPKNLKIVYYWGKGLSLFANKPFKKGDEIAYCKGHLVPAKKSTPEAVQLNNALFYDTKYLVPEDFINHSCNPNAHLDLKNRRFIAIEKIKKNEEINFNYLTTEYDMKTYKSDFKCICSAKNCLKDIKGFKYLNKGQKEKLIPYLSPFLLSKLK